VCRCTPTIFKPTVSGEPGDSPAYCEDLGTLDAYYKAIWICVVSQHSICISDGGRSARLVSDRCQVHFDQQGRPPAIARSCQTVRAVWGYVAMRYWAANVHIHGGALVEDAVILADCEIGHRRADPRASWTIMLPA